MSLSLAPLHSFIQKVFNSQGLGGGGNREFAFKRDRVSVGEDEKALEMVGGEGCTIT